MDIDSNSLSEMLKKHNIKPSHQRLWFMRSDSIEMRA